MSKKARDADASNQTAPPGDRQAEQAERDVERISGSTRPTRAKSNSAVDSPNAHDTSVLPDEVTRSDDRTIPRASDLDSAGSLDAPDDMRDMSA